MTTSPFFLLHDYFLYDVRGKFVPSAISTAENFWCAHRGSMGLLEYKAMPSLRDVAHDGVLCNISAPDRCKWCGPSGQAAWTITKLHLVVSLSFSQLGGPPCWASTLAFGLIGIAPT